MLIYRKQHDIYFSPPKVTILSIFICSHVQMPFWQAKVYIGILYIHLGLSERHLDMLMHKSSLMVATSEDLCLPILNFVFWVHKVLSLIFYFLFLDRRCYHFLFLTITHNSHSTHQSHSLDSSCGSNFVWYTSMSEEDFEAEAKWQWCERQEDPHDHNEVKRTKNEVSSLTLALVKV